VPRHEDLSAEREDAVARAQPVADGPVPHDGRSLDEEDVAREDAARVRDVGDGVARRVRGADFDEVHDTVADVDVERAFEGLRRKALFDVLEVGAARHLRGARWSGR
jgi:hypothetical protein